MPRRYDPPFKPPFTAEHIQQTAQRYNELMKRHGSTAVWIPYENEANAILDDFWLSDPERILFGYGDRVRGRHHMSAWPKPLLDCPECSADLRNVRSIKGSLPSSYNPFMKRYWRRHECPVCQYKFLSGVPLLPSEASTTDVQTRPGWVIPREVILRGQEAEARAAAIARDAVDEALERITELTARPPLPPGRAAKPYPDPDDDWDGGSNQSPD